MATVKGDVHDIGKNIVGVVLACNNYEIIDLGVMVPATKILETAKAEGVDIIGLSGLITPSLDEMAHVAAEMERDGFDIPLLIGGATTSRVHTAVKIHPRYERGQTVYVTDASRAVGRGLEPALARGEGALRRQRPRGVPQARRRARPRRGRQAAPAARRRPRQRPQDRLGRPTRRRARASSAPGSSTTWDLADLARYIDWTPFFQTWELKGRYPKILEDEAQGAAARAALRRRAGDARRRSSPSAGSSRAASSASGRRTPSATTSASSPTRPAARELATFFTLRQQRAKRLGQENVALADFVAPEGTPDYVGGFVVTAGIEEVAIAERFERANDDYSSILVKALADRFAEAFAERLHERVRREFWGYAADEALRARGADRRALPRHPPGARLSGPARPYREGARCSACSTPSAPTGVSLTESFAMWPGSSVSGLYLSHPESYYFGVAQVERDQVEDYARRKGMAVAEVERWLAPVLNYEPAGRLAAAE